MTSSSKCNHHLPSSKTDEEDHSKHQQESLSSQTPREAKEVKKRILLQGDGTACANGGGNNTLLQTQESVTSTGTAASEEMMKRDSGKEDGRERLMRHRNEVAGLVRIPEIWGQEDFLKEWMDCTVFDALLAPAGLLSARAALVREGGRVVSSGKLRYSLGQRQEHMI